MKLLLFINRITYAITQEINRQGISFNEKIVISFMEYKLIQ